MRKQEGFSKAELQHFRDVQRLANDCVVEVSELLYVGITEKKTCELMVEWFADKDIHTYFHRPFAWFGDRSAFTDFWNDFKFFPTNRRLVEGMPVILDVAPAVGGYSADIGYSFTYGNDCSIQQQIRKDLIDYRYLILEAVKRGDTFQKIYQDIDKKLEEQGYDNIHSIYPKRVLAHRVGKIDESILDRLHILGFGFRPLQWLAPHSAKIKRIVGEELSPFWNGGESSNHKPLPGVWAVEPHLGFRGIGAKWEEILVITEDDAYWLDDDVPHMVEAREKGWVENALESLQCEIA